MGCHFGCSNALHCEVKKSDEVALGEAEGFKDQTLTT